MRVWLVAALVLAVARTAAAYEPATWFSFAEEPATSLPRDVLVLPEERERVLRAKHHSSATLLERIELHVSADGRLVERTTVVQKVLTEEGANTVGNRRFGVRPALETLKVEAAYTLQADGSTERVEPDSIQFVDGSGGDIFSDARVAVLPFPNLVDGSTLVSVTARTIDAPSWPLPWSQLYGVQGPGPIERFEVVVTWDDAAVEPVWSTSDELVACSRGGERSVTCSRFKIGEVPSDPDVAWADIQTYVIVAQPQSWDELAARERQLVEGRMSDVSLEAIGGKQGSRREILERIYRFVSDDVRYVAFEHGTGAVVPRAAATTLARGYGDCKDKVTLFLSMARAAGLRARALLVGSSRYDLSTIVAPSWRWFDHMIACVDEVATEPICLELTTPNAGLGELPANLHGAIALDLGTSRTRKLLPGRLPTPHGAWSISATVKNQIDCNWNIDEHVTLRFRSAAAVAFRSVLRNATSAERRRWAEETYESVLPSAPTPSVSFGGIDEPGREVVIELKNHFEGSSPLAESDQISEQDFWLRHFASGLETGNRHHPFHLAGSEIETTVRYELCADVAARLLGPQLELKSEFGSLERSYEREDEAIVVRSRMVVNPGTVESADLERFKRFMTRSVAQSAVWLGLETRP